MSDAEWAFALRWQAQGALAHLPVKESDRRMAGLWLLKSYELGDPDAAWEIAAHLMEQQPAVGVIARLIAWAAGNGSADAAWYLRDQPGNELHRDAWDNCANRCLLGKEVKLVARQLKT